MDIVKGFFKHEDAKYNDYLIRSDYGDIKVEVSKYVRDICDTPVESYLSYIINNSIDETISSKDVFQFSDIDDATDNVCKILQSASDGLDMLQIGIKLQDDGTIRTEGASRKYGENHVKTAEALGLAFVKDKKYYISALGNEYLLLNKKEKTVFLTRLILRNKLISKLYKHSQNQNVDLEIMLYDLSESTYKRRRTNVKTIISILTNSKEYDFKEFADKIIY